MNAAIYLRRSSAHLQSDSLDAQEEVLTRWARENGHAVVAKFADSASGRSVERRDEFLRMIEIVKTGAPFQMILVRDVSRWSRDANIDTAGMYEFVCRSRGVAVVYVEESFAPDGSPYSILMHQLKRAMAAEFSFERERVVLASAVRLVKQGFWPSGSCPYGLKRVLVDERGTVIADLRPGDRKALTNHRVKFAPGDPVAVNLVKRIFAEYSRPDVSLKSIADRLADEGIPSSSGSRWTSSMISYVLQNEAYHGALVYHLRKGRDRSALLNLRGSAELEEARCDHAHEAIIADDVWNNVQRKLRAQTVRRTDQDLLAELKEAMRRWRPDARRHVLGPAAALRNGFGRADRMVLENAEHRATQRIHETLARSFHVDSVDGGLLLDHMVLVGITSSFPTARFGSLHWNFEFDKVAACDVALGLAFSPPPRVEHVDTFLFRISFLRGRNSARPLLTNQRPARHFSNVHDPERLVEMLRHQFRYRGTRPEKLFLDAVRHQERLSLRHVAAELGWPVAKVRSMYCRLDVRGTVLPPLHGTHRTRRVTVTCPHCLRQRLLTPETVLRLETEVCFECLHRPPAKPPNRLVATCPACGTKRLLTQSEIHTRARGLESLCVRCNRRSNMLKASRRGPR